MVQSFRDLEVWQKAHKLALQTFDLTEQCPNGYLYDLVPQLRRAALSVPTNLAEGCATAHTKELLQFVNIALRSVSETQYLLLFAIERKLMSEDRYRDLKDGDDEVGRMLSGLNRSLKRSRPRATSSTNHQSLTTSH